MLTSLLIFACSCIAASNGATTPAAKPVVINFQNMGTELIVITSDPVLDPTKPDVKLQLLVPAGPKAVPLTIPDFWVGEFWVKPCTIETKTKGTTTTSTAKCDIPDTEFTIPKDGKKILVGHTRLSFSNIKPMSYYYFDMDYGYDYSMRMSPDADTVRDADGALTCDRLTAIAMDCKDVKEKIETVDVPLSLAADGKRCLTPCAAIYSSTSGLTEAQAAAALPKYCVPDSETTATNLKGTNFYKKLMYSGQYLNTVNKNDPKQVSASCKATSYTLAIYPQRYDRTRLNPKNEGPFFSYPFFYSLPVTSSE